MKLKNLLYGFLYFIFAISCNERILEPEMVSQTNVLKAAAISTNRYVATTGNDNNAGTLAAPFLTIQKAADVANAGDTVFINNGTYSASSREILLFIRKSGTAENPIVFKSLNKWGAKLNGNNNSITYGIDISNGASYVKIIDLEILGFGDTGINSNDNVNVSSYITIQGCKIHDIGRLVTISDEGLNGIHFRRKYHHWTIDKNLIYNIGRIGPDTYYMNKDHAVYTGATADQAEAAHHTVITNNVMFGISGAHITNGSNYDLIANNVFAWRNENSMGASCFIAADAGVTNLTIANNIFYQPPTCNPFAVNGYAPFPGWIIKNNMVYGGSMWASSTTSTKATMAGGNYGQKDCEKAQVDPKFISALKENAPNVDFSLQSISPAINTGVNIGLTCDYLSYPIIGLPDIGAYEYQGASSTIYYNTQISATAIKNDCGAGSTGSTVTYTVTAKKYSSTVSQSAADNLATTDLNTNKQAYANANGTCSALTVYYNTLISATATKNDCGTGYTGSTVTYTVLANKYNSTVSQAAADNLAATDLNTNKQAYANANGTCTALPVSSSFGLTTVGSIPEKGDNGFWIANSFTAASNMTVSKMNIYVGTASGKARLGIYSDKAGQPGTLIAQTGEITLINGWNSGMLGSSKVLTSGVTYWIAIELTSSATTLYFNNAAGRLRYKTYTYSVLPSSAPLNCVSGTGIYSVYAN